ncbi:RNA pol II accessory factor, Cdc73 family-domain-containing protein [Hygrophoropsis aurantiaca]|uniref:RNA pol II accessory factor, Cdc73 family-domain-containing protein n=1 Tax=Hygrophoropsis aurantiaca TaxID=72124 RepID=A0ACB7ZUB7_9AGAM|nr:RNA pol II accessory factor, Cdc73 family-domain-containing protein [Hygrophoropsis aurantiaca]
MNSSELSLNNYTIPQISFELSSDARARAGSLGNSRAEDLIPIDRPLSSFSSSLSSLASQSQSHSSSSSSSQRQRYLVVDSAEALQKLGTGGSGAGGSGMGADAWDRVVCVMTTGQTWQFRPYKWAEPRALFHHVKGIYVSWANDPPNTKIKDWNVTELKIDPHRRHVDKSVVAHFWKILDDWMLANKPWLMRS